jgi:hypothetical protein
VEKKMGIGLGSPRNGSVSNLMSIVSTVTKNDF